MIESSKRGLDNLERLGFFTHTYHLAGFYRVRRDVYNLTIYYNVPVAYQLACSSTCGGNAKAEHDIVKTALKALEKNLTGDTVSLCSFLKQITELTLKYTIRVFSFLLLCQHDTVLRHLSATIVAMLSRREVSPGQNFVRAEDWFTKTTCDF